MSRRSWEAILRPLLLPVRRLARLLAAGRFRGASATGSRLWSLISVPRRVLVIGSSWAESGSGRGLSLQDPRVRFRGGVRQGGIGGQMPCSGAVADGGGVKRTASWDGDPRRR